jgi:hypothetical protein
MKGDVLDTPLGFFTRLAVINGFASRQVLVEILHEFAKIEGQGWTREILRELGETIDDGSDGA